MHQYYNVIASMKRAGLAATVLLFGLLNTGSVNAADGMVVLKSSHSVSATLDKLEAILNDKGMKIFTRVPHAEGAANAGLELRPTELLLFGNPKIGTPLMNCAQSIAIDLPQKALAWEDENGQTWLAYNDPAWLKSRHAAEGCDAVFDKVAGALANFAAAATAP